MAALPLIDTTGLSQTLLKLSDIKPGTERVQLVNNGDFQFQGPFSNGAHPFPTGWSSFASPPFDGIIEIFADAGSNMVPMNRSVVARAHVANAIPALGMSQGIVLEPATAYVLSAYMWNMGSGTNRVNAVVDFNDAPSEPQLVLKATDPDAASGYFLYRSFNTSNTGSNITLRVFYDGLSGTGTAPGHYPLAAQWDNIAITKSTTFIAPRFSGSTATLRPMVRITSPANGMYVYASEGALPLNADAVDLDGTVTNVQFFAGSSRIAEASSSPWNASWSNAMPGPHVLTAVAADNRGVTTLSAPVSVNVILLPEPPVVDIVRGTGEVMLSWPSSGNGMVAQCTSNLLSSDWVTLTNRVQVTGSSNFLAMALGPGPRYFRLVPEIDASTLRGKLMMGYQGWFGCPGDGSAVNRWIHWFRGQNPVASEAIVDFWPDLSELEPDELYPTAMTYPNGAPVKLYSAYNRKTVLRHFQWMQDHHLDGVFLQRFSAELYSGENLARMNKVADNVRVGAETYNRVFAMMYDISGQPTNTLVTTLSNDWLSLVNTLQLTNSPRYLRHNGKPVVAVWGFGFAGRPDTPQQAMEVIHLFKNLGVTVMGGLPAYWRSLSHDAQTSPAWAPVFRSFDIISPWAVGRYGDIAGADSFRLNRIVPDLAEARAYGRDYMPVIFPGFSWFNLHGGPLNQIPRRGGNFYWRQAYNAKLSGCDMIYGAMFDEVDEGTAMYKLAPTANDVPAQGSWVPLDADGIALPSDWYLRVANEAAKMLRGDIPLQVTIPIKP